MLVVIQDEWNDKGFCLESQVCMFCSEVQEKKKIFKNLQKRNSTLTNPNIFKK